MALLPPGGDGTASRRGAARACRLIGSHWILDLPAREAEHTRAPGGPGRLELNLKELREKHKVQIGRTPNDILIGMLKAWDKIAQQEADKNPFFKKVYDSQRRWAADVVTSRRTVHPSYEVGADYYWPQK
jgi:TRAP-type mannitol/chloroaromatic compound transport system substrate-binding protein